MNLSEPQQKMLEEAAANPNLRARAGHRKDRTARKLAELGLGTLSFYGALGFQINKRGLAHLGYTIVKQGPTGFANRDAEAQLEQALREHRKDQT